MPDQPLSRREALRAERAAARPHPSAVRSDERDSESPSSDGANASSPLAEPATSTAGLSEAALAFLGDDALRAEWEGAEWEGAGHEPAAAERRASRRTSRRPQAGASARPARPSRRSRREDDRAPSGHRARKAALTWLGAPALLACVALPAYALNAQGEPNGSVVGQVDPEAQSLEIASGDTTAVQPEIRDRFMALSEAEKTAIEAGRISADGIMSYLRGSDEGWYRPVAAPMTSPYGPRRIICNEAGCSNPVHEGIDFGAACGTPVKAVRGGTVSFVGADGGYGNRVIVDHGEGVSSVYGHLGTGSYRVAEGDTIEAGTFVGDVGRTGVGTGCHLDLKIDQGGSFIDPEAFLVARGVVI
ncbi:M23 family metallopeptidase [Arenivirga flava]|uniref:M23ase beta-sheet core domain-containing protein n=1 Tax=Arenivirga flava TaxID=1930060 RepID=A0AA37UL26_9MICO|nr:M23 family metallopeptidase [Arenivirga flava]GMA28422.1 hypothetical protein GCM10025874_16750 [Arenivirga flava]